MGWWGKLVGGAFGFMLGGPLGAILGAVLGHNFDRGLDRLRLEHGAGADHERIQTAFFTATFSIMGYVAKSDGRVSEGEIALARQVMAQMRLNEEQRRAAIGLFNQGKQQDFPLEGALDQFRRECHRRRQLLQMFLEIQIYTALADGELDTAERDVLLHISARLGFPREHFERLVAMVRAQQHFAGAGRAAGAPPTQGSLHDAYAVLGVNRTATDAEVKRAYRRLMNQHHPDKLVAKGLPEEMMEIAKEKSQEIRAAYDRIREARGM